MSIEPLTPPDVPEDTTVVEWLAKELVRSNCDGHEATGKRIESLSGDVRAYGKIITLALGLIAGLAGLKVLLPDGTVIEPSAAAEVANDLADADSPPPE